MDKIREALREFLEGRAAVESVLPAAPFFALLLPCLELIYQFHSFGFFVTLYSVIWILYLIGLLLCFSQGRDLWIGLAFGVRALTNFFSMFSALRLNTVIYMIFYGVLAVYFLRAWLRTSEGTEFLAEIKSRLGIGMSAEDPQAVVTCVRCGAVTSEENNFCPKCGTPLVKKPTSEKVVYCRHCGNRLEPGARFCAQCGLMVEDCAQMSPIPETAVKSSVPEKPATEGKAANPEHPDAL